MHRDWNNFYCVLCGVVTTRMSCIKYPITSFLVLQCMLTFEEAKKSTVWIRIHSEVTEYRSLAYCSPTNTTQTKASNENVFKALKPIFRKICATQNHHKTGKVSELGQRFGIVAYLWMDRQVYRLIRPSNVPGEFLSQLKQWDRSCP